MSVLEKVKCIDLGFIGYEEARQIQATFQKKLIANKRVEGFNSHDQHYLLFCEHPHVYTLGKSGSLDNLIWNKQERESRQIQFVKTNRGGDITYHGPGQLVAYPIFDLDSFFTDVHKYVRYLEEAVIRTLTDFDIQAIRYTGYTGVWLPPSEGNDRYRKICAIGVHLSRWVSMHGLALNVNSDLSYFDGIIPCGISDDGTSVTSMAKESSSFSFDMESVKKVLIRHFADLFEFGIAD